MNWPRHHCKKNNPKGFTLVEVVVSVTILAGSILVISNMWSGNFLRVRKTRLNHNVATLLESKMTEFEILYKERVNELPEEEEGEFENFKNYRWKFESQEFEMPDLSGALVSREGGADEMLISMIKQMTEYISKSVKEATLTIFVKVGKKEVAYSVTTYFIDYNVNLSIGPGGISGGQ